MKYKELDMEQVKKCCKAHAKRKYNGIHFECDKCPLRRERIDRLGKKHTLFCYYTLRNMYEETIEDFNDLLEEEIPNPTEWEDFTKQLESVE